MIIEIEIADENYQTVVDAVCLTGNYRDEVDDGSGLNVMIPNPQTKDAFVVSELKKTLGERISLAQNMAQKTVIL